MPPDEKGEISRRAVIATAAMVPVAALTAAAQTPAASALQAGPALSAGQLRILAAFVDRLIPKDELGPSASESDVPVYVDRALSDYLAGEKPAFIEGLEATDAYARRSQGMGFVDLPADKQDAVLMAMDNGAAEGFSNARAFFNRARRLAMEGMFGDPHYGGNKNFVGWDLIRYPGPRMATTAADQKMGVEIKPYHHSAYGDHAGEKHGH